MNTNPPDPELLSAYADGEVSESERAQVEQWLAQNPRGRHAVARVHVLASALRSLHREELPVEFGETLQRQIAGLPAPSGPASGPTAVSAPAASPAASQASPSAAANGSGWGRRWLPALAASVALGVPLLAWRLTSPEVKGPQVFTDAKRPAGLAEPSTDTVVPMSRAMMPDQGPQVAGQSARLLVSRQQLKSQLVQAPRDRVQVVTVEFAGAEANPRLAQAWRQELCAQLAEQGFRDVSDPPASAARRGPAPQESPVPSRRPVDGAEVEAFFVLLEGDVDALVAALEKTIEQSQQEEQIVGWAEAELQWLDEELQQAANSVKQEEPAGQLKKMADVRRTGTKVSVASDAGRERGRMILGTAPLQQVGEQVSEFPGQSAEHLTRSQPAGRAMTRTMEKGSGQVTNSATAEELSQDVASAKVAAHRRAPAGAPLNAPQRAAPAAAAGAVPGAAARAVPGAAAGAVPGAGAKPAAAGLPAADSDQPQSADTTVAETRRVLIQVRMPMIGTPASSLSPAAEPAPAAAPAPPDAPAPARP